MAKSKLVKTNKKIAEKVTETYQKIEDTVVGGYTKIEDAFVDRYLTKEGESCGGKSKVKARTGYTAVIDKASRARQRVRMMSTCRRQLVFC